MYHIYSSRAGEDYDGTTLYETILSFHKLYDILEKSIKRYREESLKQNGKCYFSQLFILYEIQN